MTVTPTFPISAPVEGLSSSSGGTAAASAPSISGQRSRDEYTVTVYDNEPDIDDDRRFPVPGYPTLTKLIVDYPDFEAFQSFRDLNIKSLLYYQAELEELRRDLHALEWRDYRDEPFPDSEMCCLTYEAIMLGRNAGDESAAGMQYAKIQRIREVLKEYSTFVEHITVCHHIINLIRIFLTDAALIQYSKIRNLPEADSFNVSSLRRWLHGRRAAKRIRGPGAWSWGNLGEQEPAPKSLVPQIWQFMRSFFWPVEEEKPEEDLIVPRAGSKADSFSRWVANEFVPLWQCLKEKRFRGERPTGGQASVDVENAKTQNTRAMTAETDIMTINRYRENPILRFTSFVSMVVACLLPTVAIAVLAQLHTTAQLLGLIAVFTAVFAAGLMVLVEVGTSRVEIFAATAA